MNDEQRAERDVERRDEEPRHAPLPPRVVADGVERDDPKGAEKMLDRLLSVQRPLVIRQIRGLRAKHPDATPQELIARIEKQYLNSITVTGGAAGAAAVVPGIGTLASAGITGVETVGFLEMTALYGQAIAEIHGIPTSDPVRARTLIMSLMLGDTGRKLVGQFAGQVTGRGPKRDAFWGEVVAKSLPASMVGELAQRIRKAFVKRFLRRTGAGAIGRLLPFGIGAVVGGAGNRVLGGRIVDSARDAFGPAPALFPVELQEVRPARAEGPGRSSGPFLFFPVRLALGRKQDADAQ